MHISIGFSANLSVSVSVSVDTEINKNGLCICTGGYRDQLDGILGGGCSEYLTFELRKASIYFNRYWGGFLGKLRFELRKES